MLVFFLASSSIHVFAQSLQEAFENAWERQPASQAQALRATKLAARKLAGEVRDAYWQARLAETDGVVARRRLDDATALVAEVERGLNAP